MVARAEGGDLAFLDLTAAAFDLSDRGVDGRTHPGPLDAWAWTERGIYRPGETVNLLALLRTAAGEVADVPLTVRLRRPNGTVAVETVPPRGPGGAIALGLPLAPGAPLGGWTIELLADAGAAPIGRAGFRVEDFVPDRLAVEITPPAALVPGRPLAVPVTARFLYGAAASGLAASAELLVVPDPEPFPALSGWQFGLVQEAPDPVRLDVAMPATDAAGRSSANRRPVHRHPPCLSGRRDRGRHRGWVRDHRRRCRGPRGGGTAAEASAGARAARLARGAARAHR
nr:MG2 domain-containing protein [Acetobacteraceae bacterium]